MSSKYKLLASDLAKLELDTKPRKSGHSKGATTRLEKTAASSARTTSSSNTRSSRASGSGTRRSSRLSTQQQASASQQGSIQEEHGNDSDDDDSNDSDPNERDHEEHNDRNDEYEDPSIALRRRINALCSIFSDNYQTPQELAQGQHPLGNRALSQRTTIAASLRRNLEALAFRRPFNRAVADSILLGIDEDDVIRETIRNMHDRLGRIRDNLEINLRTPNAGRNVDGTVTDLLRLQTATYSFVVTYQDDLDNEHATQLADLIARTFYFIVVGDASLYQGTENMRAPFVDSVDPGNLYRRWLGANDDVQRQFFSLITRFRNPLSQPGSHIHAVRARLWTTARQTGREQDVNIYTQLEAALNGTPPQH